MLLYCSPMSSPPLPSAPLADRLAWLAAEARADKDEAGMIAAALIEVFARLLTCLAGLVARREVGTLEQPPLRAISAPSGAAAPVVLPLEDPSYLPASLAGGMPTTRPQVTFVPPSPGARGRGRISPARRSIGTTSRRRTPSPVPSRKGTGEDCPIATQCSVAATWRRLPVSTAGPTFQYTGLHAIRRTSVLLRYRNVILYGPFRRGRLPPIVTA